jgi:hypothetical protein
MHYELRAQLKRLKSIKKLLQNQVKGYEKGRKKDELELKKLQASLAKEHAALSNTRMIYAMARHNIDVLAAAVKELNSANRKLKKKEKADLSLKYEHDEKMMQMQLQPYRYISKFGKEKRDGKDLSAKLLLDNKKAQTLLTCNLRKQSKDDDILRRELAKEWKDTHGAEAVGVIAPGIKNTQMNSNNEQFNAHVRVWTR